MVQHFGYQRLVVITNIPVLDTYSIEVQEFWDSVMKTDK
jgi:hypothetical protein